MLKANPAAGIVAAIFTSALPFTATHAFADETLPVTIYANQAQEATSLGKVGSSVTVLTEDDIRKSGAQTVGDALRHVSGLSVGQSGGPGQFTQVRIRGSEANHVMLIVDGVQYNDPSGIGYDFSGLLAANVETIEIIRGPQSGIYGSGAHAGVIAITTKSGKGLRKPVVSAQAEAGSFSTLLSSIFAAGGDENVWMSLGASGLTTDGYNISTAGTEADGSSIGNMNLRMGLNPVNGFDIDGSLRFATREADFDDTNFGNASAPPLTDAAGPHYNENDFGGRIAANYTIPGTEFKQHVSWDGYGFLRGSVDQYGPFESEGARNEALYRASYTLRTPDFAESKHDTSLQVSHEWLTYDTNFNMLPAYQLETTSFAGEWRSSFYNRYFLTAAVRHDLSQQFEDATTGRLTARANNDDGFSVHAAVGTGVTNPTMDELFGSNNTFVGNPDLKPEESFEWEIGVSQNWNVLPISTGITYFDGQTRNEIRTVFSPTNTAINDPGISRRRGLETMITWAPMPGLNFSGTYTYTDARTSAGLEETRRPPHSGSIDADMRFLEDKLGLKVGVAFNGTMQDDDFRVAPSMRVQLPGYTLLNTQLSYQLTPQAEAYVRVQNALDQQYQEVFGYRGQPLSAYAGMKLRFGE
ncbi:MAG: TonB-dependent receptor [Pseudomonadota bacterium]